jgi:general secretion pathway protein G
VVALKKEIGKQQENRLTRHNEKGFTLIELMVVIVILGILAGMIVPKIMDRPEEARRTKAGIDIGALTQALKMYHLDNGRYPTTDQGLQALIEPPSSGQLAKKWREGGYLDKSAVPKDPWENDYIYISPGLHSSAFDIMSYGPDGEPGGEGMDADINSWEL